MSARPGVCLQRTKVQITTVDLGASASVRHTAATFSKSSAIWGWSEGGDHAPSTPSATVHIDFRLECINAAQRRRRQSIFMTMRCSRHGRSWFADYLSQIAARSRGLFLLFLLACARSTVCLRFLRKWQSSARVAKHFKGRRTLIICEVHFHSCLRTL
jgi:hypothetical protein